MDQITVGIDLGTTNSVIAVPGHFPELGQVYGPVTVLWDENNRLTQASAVCEVDGALMIGDDAKALASEGYTPVRFVKKYIGTEHLSQVGKEEWLPERVSAEVIRHMVGIAEKALKAKVTQAIVTHPAYFDALAIGKTQEAGRIAGLSVDGRMMMEPVAAAMAYTHTNTKPRLRVLVYDLGGGTFDITLVDRSGGTFRPIGFGGDRELGGYNFDKKIATHMLKQLRDKGYVLTIDPDHPEQDSRWATLMHYAERVKIKLSEAVKADVRVPGVFPDNSTPAKQVQLAFSLTRKEFLEMIEPELAKTMWQTLDVLKGANLVPADATLPLSEPLREELGKKVDNLVLVGGSCRVPAVRDRLLADFGLDPEYDEDVLDLSVAAGAAMVAMTSGSTEGGVTLAFIPDATDDKELQVRGQVQKTEERSDVEDFSVTVTGGASGESSSPTGKDGRFLVSVELNEDSENDLAITVSAPDGTEIYRKDVKVAHRADAEPPPPPPSAILPKPVSVDTDSGLVEIAAEGVLLPYKGKAPPFKTLEELREIEIFLYQEDILLSTLLLTGFDRPVPENSKVELELEIGADYAMKVTGSVPNTNIRKTQEVRLKPPPVRTIEYLKDEYAKIRSVYEDQLEITPDGEAKARIAAECERVIEEIDELLGSEFPEKLQIEMLVKKLHVLTKKLPKSGGLTPEKAELDRALAEARELLPKAEAKKPELKEDKLGVTLKALESEAARAYQQMDQLGWGRVAGKLNEIVELLKGHLSTGGGGGPRPPAPVMKMALDQMIGDVRGRLDSLSKDRAAKCKTELDEASRKLDKVDLSDDDRAFQEMVGIYQQHVKPAQDLVNAGSGPDRSKIKIGVFG